MIDIDRKTDSPQQLPDHDSEVQSVKSSAIRRNGFTGSTDALDLGEAADLEASPASDEAVELDEATELNEPTELGDPTELDDSTELDEPTELDELEKKQSRSRRIIVRIIAMLLTVSFLFLAFSGMLYFLKLPSLGLLIESIALSRDPKYDGLRQSVVIVQAENRQGTGFIVQSDGLIVTNAHIIEQASEVRIGLTTDDIHLATSWQQWPQLDLALIQFDGQDLPTLELEQENNMLLPGDPVTVIGTPLGLFQIVSEAEYIGQAASSDNETLLLMIRGPVYRGNSGSPVINAAGKVIGILFAVSDVDNTDPENRVGFVIPVSEIRGKIAEMADD